MSSTFRLKMKQKGLDMVLRTEGLRETVHRKNWSGSLT